MSPKFGKENVLGTDFYARNVPKKWDRSGSQYSLFHGDTTSSGQCPSSELAIPAAAALAGFVLAGPLGALIGGAGGYFFARKSVAQKLQDKVVLDARGAALQKVVMNELAANQAALSKDIQTSGLTQNKIDKASSEGTGTH